MPQESIETYGESDGAHEEQNSAGPILITFEDLVVTCTNCGGTGQEPELPVPVQSTSTYGRHVISGLSDTQCAACHGKGRVLTSQGEILAKFMDLMSSKGVHRRLS